VRGISLHRGPSEEPKRGFVYGRLRQTEKEGSGNGACLSLSLLGLCKGHLEGVPLEGNLTDR
jgi:hypothetical protein